LCFADVQRQEPARFPSPHARPERGHSQAGGRNAAHSPAIGGGRGGVEPAQELVAARPEAVASAADRGGHGGGNVGAGIGQPAVGEGGNEGA